MLRYHFYFKFVYIRTIDEDELRLCYILQRSLCVIRLQQVYVFFFPWGLYIFYKHSACFMLATTHRISDHFLGISFWSFWFSLCWARSLSLSRFSLSPPISFISPLLWVPLQVSVVTDIVHLHMLVTLSQVAFFSTHQFEDSCRPNIS